MVKYLREPPDSRTIAETWDRVAPQRLKQLSHDVSYQRHLRPAIMSELDGMHGTLLDVGCGVGDIARAAAATFDTVLGIDISVQSVAIASQVRPARGLSFKAIDALDFYGTDQFHAVVSNMFLMDAPNLEEHVHGMARCLRPEGRLIATLLHPAFWPLYWGYIHEPWFKYEAEIAISSEFRVSTAKTIDIETVHFHRPVERYLKAFAAADLKITKFIELTGAADEDTLWGRVPRYLLIVAKAKVA